MAPRIAEHLYLLSRQRAAQAPAALERLPRPYVWLHSDTAHEVPLLAALSEAILMRNIGVGVLLSMPTESVSILPEMPGRVILPVDDDASGLVQALLARDHAPSAMALATHTLPAGMIAALARQKIPVFAIDADAPGLAAGWRHVPGFSRSVLSKLEKVFLQSSGARDVWLEHGLPEAALTLCGRLSANPPALSCNEAEREALADAFRHRTVWLAAGLPEREEDAIIAAHREALRESHRLALILHPADPMRGPELKARLDAQFSTALRSVDDLVTPETQVYVVDTEGERGLWYRLAVACYLGGSLSSDGAAFSPLEPAGLGCAIVHGRMFGRHSAAFDSLREARATRMIQSAEALGAAICTALRPEQAADQAHRGWQVISSGYEATEMVLDSLLIAATKDGA